MDIKKAAWKFISAVFSGRGVALLLVICAIAYLQDKHVPEEAQAQPIETRAFNLYPTPKDSPPAPRVEAKEQMADVDWHSRYGIVEEPKDQYWFLEQQYNSKTGDNNTMFCIASTEPYNRSSFQGTRMCAFNKDSQTGFLIQFEKPIDFGSHPLFTVNVELIYKDGRILTKKYKMIEKPDNAKVAINVDFAAAFDFASLYGDASEIIVQTPTVNGKFQKMKFKVPPLTSQVEVPWVD